MANVSQRESASARKRTCPRCGATYDGDALFCAKDGATLAWEDEDETDPYIGTLISGDIEIQAVCGVGAMGRVYRAHQRGIDRMVAVKILHRELSGNTQLVQRFHREAKIASKLSHPHVVEVFLAGQLPDKALFIVMEFLDGMSLGEALTAAGGLLDPPRALSIALQICDAVGEGHARGIVHRDLKPENVMLVKRADMTDWVKVLDFGIAKVQTVEQSMQTAAGLVFGTARYISPEGAQGIAVGPPGDVYSLATIVYQTLSGQTPFDAEPVGLLIKHIHETPPLLTSLPRAADIPPALARVVMDNLAKDPEKRAPNARAFGAELAQAAKDANIAIAETGIVARFAGERRDRPTLEPTLDDNSPQNSPQNSPRNVSHVPTAPPPRSGAPSSTLPLRSAPPSAVMVSLAPPSRESREEPAPETRVSGRAPAVVDQVKKRPLGFIVLAFLLGAALAVIAMGRIEHRGDAAHEAWVAKTRTALSEGRYVIPPNDCVHDLVIQGLKRWPNDLDLIRLRSTASMELVTRAMVAQNGGDVSGALDLARDASQIDPADHSATLLVREYDDEMKRAQEPASADGGVPTGKPRVVFDVLPPTHPAKRIDLAARIITARLGEHARIESVTMTLFDHSGTSEGVKIPVVPSGQHLYRATLAAPKAGNYDVVFEATLEGASLRAVRELIVLP